MLLSVFNDPSNTVKYGSPDEVVELAKRAKDKKFQILLELHFSDNFTSNTTQSKPNQWKSFTDKKLINSVYEWSKEIMQKLDSVNALPEIVSIGHEIENGFLFSEPTQSCIKSGGYIGSSTCRQKNMFYFVSLLKSAIHGIRSVSHQPRIMLHTSLANQLFLGRNAANAIIQFYSELNEQWKVPFDVIGLTFYPIRAHGCEISKLHELKYIYEYFGGRFSIVIAETGYPSINPNVEFNCSYQCSQEGQYLFLHDLIHTCRDKLEGICTGVFWNSAYMLDQYQLRPWQGPLFDLSNKTPLKALTQGFAP